MGRRTGLKGRETITEFTFTAASGCRKAESMDAKLDEDLKDLTEDNEAGDQNPLTSRF